VLGAQLRDAGITDRASAVAYDTDMLGALLLMISGALRPVDKPGSTARTQRFPGRLIAERRIRFVRVSRQLPTNFGVGSSYSNRPPERPIFETEARDYWARIGHGAGVINFDSTRFAGHEIPPDKARREVARR
jgi:hypothetical protein